MASKRRVRGMNKEQFEKIYQDCKARKWIVGTHVGR